VGRETKKQTHCDLELKITKRSQIIEELRGFFARGTPVTPTVAQQKGRNKPTEALEIVRKALRTARMRLAGDYINEPKPYFGTAEMPSGARRRILSVTELYKRTQTIEEKRDFFISGSRMLPHARVAVVANRGATTAPLDLSHSEGMGEKLQEQSH